MIGFNSVSNRILLDHIDACVRHLHKNAVLRNAVDPANDVSMYLDGLASHDPKLQANLQHINACAHKPKNTHTCTETHTHTAMYTHTQRGTYNKRILTRIHKRMYTYTPPLELQECPHMYHRRRDALSVSSATSWQFSVCSYPLLPMGPSTSPCPSAPDIPSCRRLTHPFQPTISMLPLWMSPSRPSLRLFWVPCPSRRLCGRWRARAGPLMMAPRLLVYTHTHTHIHNPVHVTTLHCNNSITTL
jgi:hypothetical protein